MEPAKAPDRSGRSIATETTEGTEMGEKDERMEAIVGAAIEVHLDVGCPRLVDRINQPSQSPRTMAASFSTSAKARSMSNAA